ncbi:MAG: DNA-processing protein DprA, partial [Spirochaetaceae bacterium]|nr:DNA-processing protein DprA [Spirochaetaceae bacterium]
QAADNAAARISSASPGLMHDLRLLLAIHRMEFLHTGEKIRLVDEAGCGERLLRMSFGDIQRIANRPIRETSWVPGLCWEKAGRDMEYLVRSNACYVSIFDEGYPPQLRETFHPPFGLFVRGRLPAQDRPSVSVVGTRIASVKGISAAHTLAREISEEGFCVISGLARGIDSSAHRGALKGKGGTVAVLPRGIEAVYPSSNKPLAAAILDDGGALVTEYPLFSSLSKYRFPERNRIIAGLSRSCVVVEAPEKSGALITAEFALSEGRDVYVHSACSGNLRNEGADALALEGAKSISSAADIFADWEWQGARQGLALTAPSIEENR